MEKYTVEVKQTALRYIDVFADNEQEAIDIVQTRFVIDGSELPDIDEERPLEFGILPSSTSEMNTWLFSDLEDLIDSGI